MSWTVPTGAVQQPEENVGRSQQGDKTRQIAYKGPYAALESAGDALTTDDVIVTGWKYSSHDVRRVPGGLGVLTINCIPVSPTSGAGTEQSPTVIEPLKDIWSIRSVRNDVSIMAYCGDGENEPNRALIEAWMKEPDGALAKNHQFRKPDGEIVQLTTEAATMDLVAKIEKGIESVIRFYPVVTRTRTYAECPPECLKKVGFIDDPPAPTGTAKKPSGLATQVALHQWLKVQDDAQELQDGKWTRTESWWGIKKTDDANSAPWDADLYGANRWSMPYNHQAEAQG